MPPACAALPWQVFRSRVIPKPPKQNSLRNFVLMWYDSHEVMLKVSMSPVIVAVRGLSGGNARYRHSERYGDVRLTGYRRDIGDLIVSIYASLRLCEVLSSLEKRVAGTAQTMPASNIAGPS